MIKCKTARYRGCGKDICCKYCAIVDGCDDACEQRPGVCSFAVLTDEVPIDNPVSHPSYYADGKIEVVDFIDDKGLNFCRGSAVKYIARAGKKDPAKEAEDLKKAAWCINYEIKKLEMQNHAD